MNCAQIRHSSTKPCQETQKRNQIYIGSLPSFTKKSNILDYFASLSVPVISIKVFTDKNHKLCKGYAFVSLPDSYNVSPLLAQEHFILNRKVVFDVYTSGQKLQEKKRSIEKRRVFVSNIPQKMGNIELKEIFSRFGEVVTAYRIRKYGTGKLMPYGYLFFRQETAAASCVEDGGVFVSEEHGWVFAEPYSKDRGEKEKRRAKRRRVLDQRRVGESSKNPGRFEKKARSRGQYISSENQGNKFVRGFGENPNCDQNNSGKSNYFGNQEQYRPVFKSQNVEINDPKMVPARKLTSSCRNSTELNAPEENTDSFGSVNSPQMALDIEAENKRKLRKKKKLNRRIKKQLVFDNFKPCEVGYWDASLKRQAYFLKFRENNFRINHPSDAGSML